MEDSIKKAASNLEALTDFTHVSAQQFCCFGDGVQLPINLVPWGQSTGADLFEKNSRQAGRLQGLWWKIRKGTQAGRLMEQLLIPGAPGRAGLVLE